jgi:hypothetical protein
MRWALLYDTENLSDAIVKLSIVYGHCLQSIELELLQLGC